MSLEVRQFAGSRDEKVFFGVGGYPEMKQVFTPNRGAVDGPCTISLGSML